MSKETIRLTLNKLFIYFILGTVLNVFLSCILNLYSEFKININIQNIISGLEFSLILFFLLPYLHEYCHKKCYEHFSENCDVEMEIRKGSWCVKDKSEQFYNKKQMIIILLSPIIVTILFTIGFIISCIYNDIWFEIITSTCAVGNLAGMILGHEYTDIKSAYKIFKEKEYTKFRYLNGDTLDSE